MGKSQFPDPFEEARNTRGYSVMNDQDDPVTMVLRLKDVRKCAHKWQLFSSDSQPGRIVVPSEVNIRSTRQVPIEMDPPQHTAYRALVEPWFKRPLEAGYQEKLQLQIQELVEEVLREEQFEVVENFALKLQSRTLTLLLNLPYEESETWISWGTHVFRSEGVALDGDKAAILYDYIDEQIEKARNNPGDDLYSVLLSSEVEGRRLTLEEVRGVMILTFAGGRDTVINAVTNTVAYLAENPKALAQLRAQPEVIGRAVEELVRYFTPLTQFGRVVREDTEICEHAVKADSRIAMCWASANRDTTAFKNPNEVQLDRKVNPHVGFGFSHHNCLGATHARQLLKALLIALSQKVSTIELFDAEENIEGLGEFKRKVGFHKLTARFNTYRKS